MMDEDYLLQGEGEIVEETIDITTITPMRVVSDSAPPLKGSSFVYGTSGYESLKLNIDGQEKIFEDGFGLLLNTLITYDLRALKLKKFRGLYGIDGNIYRNSDTSLDISIIGDGRVLYASNLLDFDNPSINFDIDISGVEILDINMTGGVDGNSRDVAVLASPEFVVDRGPSLTETRDMIQEIGLDIPDIEKIYQMESFDSNRLVAYHNIRILRPTDVNTKVDEANKIPLDDKLNEVPLEDYKLMKKDRMTKYLTYDSSVLVNGVLFFYRDKEVEKREITLFYRGESISKYRLVETQVTIHSNQIFLDVNSSEILDLKEKLDEYLLDNIYESVGGRRVYKDKIRYVRDGETYYENLDLYQLDSAWEILKEDTLSVTLEIIALSEGERTLISNKYNLDYMLFTYVYFERWYNFTIGDINFADIVFYANKMFSSKSLLTPKALFDEFKKIDKKYLESNKVATFFNKRIRALGGMWQYSSYIEDLISRLEGRTDYCDWFVDNFEGIICERNLDIPLQGAYWRAWDNLKRNRSNSAGDYLALALAFKGKSLALSSTASSLFISDLKVYGLSTDEEIEGYRSEVEKYLELSVDHYNTIFRVINREEITVDYANPHFDTLQIKNGQWINPNDEYYEGINQFFMPLRIVTNSSVGYAGVANGYTSNLGWCHMLSMYGFSVWTHEVTHNQDGKIWLEGYGRRNGMWAEDYATGLYEYDTTEYWSMNFGEEIDITANNYTNYSMDRFTDGAEFQEYFRRANDLSMALNLLEVEYLAGAGSEAQAKAFDRYNYGSVNVDVYGNRDQTKAHYTDVSIEEAKSMSIKSIDDVIDNRLILFRNKRGRGMNMGGNSYAKPPLSVGYTYFPLSNVPSGRVPSEFFKRISFLLFGLYDYEEGYLKYASNILEKYEDLSDVDIIRNIAKDNTLSAESFNKMIYRNVKNRMDREGLSVYSVDELRGLIKEAYELDSVKGGYKNIENLRLSMWKEFKRVTNEFEKDIFGKQLNRDAIAIDTVEKFININKDRSETYILEKDIDFTDFDVTFVDKGIIEGDFTGKIIGNGYKITGLKRNLFNNIIGGELKDIIVVKGDINPNRDGYESTPVGIVAREIRGGRIYNLTVTESKIETKDSWQQSIVSSKLYNSSIDGLTLLNNTIKSNYGKVGMVCAWSDEVYVNNFNIEGTIYGKYRLGMVVGTTEKGPIFLTNGRVAGTIYKKTDESIGTLIGVDDNPNSVMVNVVDEVILKDY